MTVTKKYLIRKAVHHRDHLHFFQIFGPFSVTEVLTMVKNGGVDPQGEACAQNEYWFFLSDKSEVKKNFFLDQLPFVSDNSQTGEITQPDISSDTVTAEISETQSEKATPVINQPRQVERSQIFTFLMALVILLCFMSFVWVLRSLRAQ